jgi:hypothetical protein
MLRRVAMIVALTAFIGSVFSHVTAVESADSSGPVVATSSLMVKLVEGLSPEEQAAVIVRNGGIETSSIPALRLHIVEIATADLNATLLKYQADPQVVNAEVNQTRQAEAAPSDPFYASQWALPKIGWDTVFGTVAPLGSAVVAILDTGVDASQPDLADRLVPGVSILDGSNGQTDPHGHGTWLTGIVAAVTDNDMGIAGIGYAGVNIMPVTVLGADGTGQDSDVIKGVLWAADHGADVILMGFSNSGFSQNLQDAIDYAWSKGAVLAAATGNESLSTPTYPAGDRGVIGVSATDGNDLLTIDSNYGSDVFLAAPGVGIYTTGLSDTYLPISGTSASAAIVAGAGAFLRAVDPTLSNGVIVGRLARTADPAGTQEQTGNGRVNLARALADTSTDEIEPAGSPPVGGGGPFVGPYVAAALNVNSVPVGSQTGSLTYGTSGSVTHLVTVSVTGGSGSLIVTPSVSGLPSGASGSFFPISLTFSAAGSQTTTLTILTVATTPAGATTFTVTASPRTGTGTLTVSKANTTTTITTDLSAATVVGQAYDVAFTVAAPGSGTPTGNVTVSDGSVSCLASVATGHCSLTSTTAGTPKTITATYAGDGNFNGSASAGVNHTVNKASTTTTLASSVNPSVFGQSVTFTATVTGPGVTPTGTVQFKVDGVNLGVPVALVAGAATSTSTTTIPVAGSPHSVTADYNGDTNYNSGTGTLAGGQTVNHANTTTTITAPGLNPATDVGQSYTVSWTVAVVAPGSGTPTGIVTVSDGTDTCNATLPATSCLLTSTTAGSPKTLTATYSGDANFNGSSDTQTHNVNKVAATTTLASSQNPSTFGQSVNFTATVTGAGATPTGTVQFKVDGVNLDGLATLVAGVATSVSTTTIPVAGSPHSVTADYSGDPNYNNGTGTLAGGQTVGQASTTISITSDLPDPSVVGEPVVVNYTAMVMAPGAGTPSGAVTISVNDASGNTCTGTVAGGTCTLTLTTVGAKTLTATLAADANFNGSTSAGEGHQVNAATTTTTITNAAALAATPTVVGESYAVNWSVTVNSPGSGTPAGTVTITGGSGCSAAVAAGTCMVTSTSAGAKSLVATYGGTSDFNGSASAGAAHTVNPADTTTTITLDSPDPSETGQAVTVNYSVAVTAPGSGTPTGNVKITVNDASGNTCTGTVAAGTCSLTLTTAGTKTLTAKYEGDSNFNTSTSAGTSHDVKNPATLTITSVSAFQLGIPGDFVVMAGDSVRIEVTVANGAAPRAQANTVSASALTITPTGTASAGPCSGPVPASGNIAQATDMTFRFTCPVSGNGTLIFSATASGTDAITSATVNASAVGSNIITVDSSAPTMGLSPASGTYNVPFSFNWAITDPAAGGVSSGVNNATCSVTVDGSSVSTACLGSHALTTAGPHTVVVSASDISGNAGSDTRTYTIVLDNTPPVIVEHITGTLGLNGWYTSDVSVTFTVTDPESAVTSRSASCTTDLTSTLINADTTDTPVTCTATSAGGTATKTLHIKRDATKPTATASPDRAADHGGWYNHALTVSFTGSDATSLIASCSADILSSGPDNGSASVQGTCTDNAGNVSDPAVFDFKFDASAPSVAATPSRVADHNNWYNHALSVHFAGTDAVSGIASCDADSAYSGPDTNAASVSGHCTNGAGLEGTGTLNFMYDATAPTNVVVNADRGPDMGGYYNHALTATWSGTDATSLIDTCTSTNYSGPDTNTGSLPGHCTDKAGNDSAPVDFMFKYDATPPTVTVALGRLADHNNWYNHAVGFTVTGNDATSGIDTCDANGTYSTPDSASASLIKHCTDKAGNTGEGNVSFMYDATPPTGVSGAPNRTADHNTWYNHAVEVDFHGTDATSGIDSCSTPIYSGPDSLTASKDGHCTDMAGNTSTPDTTSSTFKYDATKPTLAYGAQSPAANAAGWNKTDVSFPYTSADNLSGVDTSMPSSPLVLTAEGSAVTGTVTVMDVAGNSDTFTSPAVKIDKTPPAYGAPVRALGSEANASGWNKTDVTVNFSCTDALSLPVTNPVMKTLTGEGAGQTASTAAAECVDHADNPATSGASLGNINIDKTAPTLTGSRAPAANLFGWNNTDVTASFVCTDGLSGVATGPVTPQVVSTEGANQSRSASCTDLADNTSNATVDSISIDKTVPTASATPTPGSNGFGWNNTNVVVSFSGIDTLSGIDTCDPDVTLSAEATGQSVSGKCKDKAGNMSALATASGINIDKTAPTVTGTPDRPADHNTWYNHLVTVTWTGNDTLSMIDTCSAASPYNGPDTMSASISGTCKDKAGNVGNGSFGFKFDKTPPTINIVAPANANYILNAAVASDYSCSDVTSGITVSNCVGPVANGSNFSTNPVAGHTFTVNATDNAGNIATLTNNYTVLYVSGGICYGDAGHQLLQPINADGTSVFKQKSTVPAKFRVCDANGLSIGTPGVVASFRLMKTVSGTVVDVVDEAVDSTTPDAYFRWDFTAQQWIFNMNTKSLLANVTYFYRIALNDGTSIDFTFGLK